MLLLEVRLDHDAFAEQEAKFRRIKLSYRPFQDAIGQFPHGMLLMEHLGFVAVADGGILELPMGSPLSRLQGWSHAMLSRAPVESSHTL